MRTLLTRRDRPASASHAVSPAQDCHTPRMAQVVHGSTRRTSVSAAPSLPDARRASPSRAAHHDVQVRCAVALRRRGRGAGRRSSTRRSISAPAGVCRRGRQRLTQTRHANRTPRRRLTATRLCGVRPSLALLRARTWLHEYAGNAQSDDGTPRRHLAVRWLRPTAIMTSSVTTVNWFDRVTVFLQARSVVVSW